MAAGDAKFALVSCHFKSSAHQDSATCIGKMIVIVFVMIKSEPNYGNAHDFNNFRSMR